MLRRAVSNDGFELHFQPIRRAADNGLAGFEALLRLPKNGGGHVSPRVSCRSPSGSASSTRSAIG